MAQYVITRDPIMYNDGSWSDRCYYKQTGLGIFVECTSKIEEAKCFDKKAEAIKTVKSLGLNKNWHVMKMG